MKGEYAFCPQSGAPLSEEVHYDDRGRAQRVPVYDDFPGRTPDGELTNGSLRSARVALFNHFRRSYRRHHDEDDGSLFSKAALGLTRLKRAAEGDTEWDVYVWYALAEWLREEYDVRWMHAHVEPRCPDCAGQLQYESLGDGDYRATCATTCAGHHGDSLATIAETVCRLYARAFDDPAPDADELLLV